MKVFLEIEERLLVGKKDSKPILYSLFIVFVLEILLLPGVTLKAKALALCASFLIAPFGLLIGWLPLYFYVGNPIVGYPAKIKTVRYYLWFGMLGIVLTIAGYPFAINPELPLHMVPVWIGFIFGLRKVYKTISK